MEQILSPQQRVLILVAVLLFLLLVWVRLLSRMTANQARLKGRNLGNKGGARHCNTASLSSKWKEYLAAIMLGNTTYFLLYPYLPSAAQHRSLVDMGTLVDLWFCVVFYGLLELGLAIGRRMGK
jgi:hypothetical protein